MRQSCQIASKAFIEAMMSTKPGSTEHQLYARLDYECRMGGAEYLAYPPVVAAGNNANTLHYIDNKQQIKYGDLILVDAGEIKLIFMYKRFYIFYVILCCSYNLYIQNYPFRVLTVTKINNHIMITRL